MHTIIHRHRSRDKLWQELEERFVTVRLGKMERQTLLMFRQQVIGAGKQRILMQLIYVVIDCQCISFVSQHGGQTWRPGTCSRRPNESTGTGDSV